MTSLTNKKEGFEHVILTITSRVRLYSEAKTNLFQIEYFHFHIIDHSFQCEFQILIHMRVC